EQWAFVDVKNSNYKLMVARHSEKCLDKAWSGAVVQWQCHGGDEWWQQWRLAYITEGESHVCGRAGPGSGGAGPPGASRGRGPGSARGRTWPAPPGSRSP